MDELDDPLNEKKRQKIIEEADRKLDNSLQEHKQTALQKNNGKRRSRREENPIEKEYHPQHRNGCCRLHLGQNCGSSG